MKKAVLSFAASLLCSTVFAGGLLTNTNQNVHFLRNPARDASTDIDAVYSNPAGLSFLDNEGLTISLNNQTAHQTRTITSTFAPFAANGGNATKEYEGIVDAPIIPSVQAVYKAGDWAFSGSFAIVGGGGTAKFDNGLPSFESTVSLLPAMLSGAGIPATRYALESYLEGTQITYGAQLGAGYKMTENLSVFAGLRASFVGNGYEGYIRNIQANLGGGSLVNVNSYFTNAAQQAQGLANSLQPIIDGGAGSFTLNQLVAFGLVSSEQLGQIAAGLGQEVSVAGNFSASAVQGVAAGKAAQASAVAAQTADKELDVTQFGWGVAPVFGLDFNYKNLNIGVKYEFRTNINVKNDTKRDDTGLFPDGAETYYDIPALLTAGAEYAILPSLRVSAGYHHYFDKQAKMKNLIQNKLDYGTNEYIFGAEFDPLQWLTLSAGVQRTDYGITDEYLSDMSFNIDATTFGLGAAVKLHPKLTVNLAYFWSNYDDYTKPQTSYNGLSLSGTDVFSRTNRTFGVGVDYRF